MERKKHFCIKRDEMTHFLNALKERRYQQRFTFYYGYLLTDEPLGKWVVLEYWYLTNGYLLLNSDTHVVGDGLFGYEIQYDGIDEPTEYGDKLLFKRSNDDLKSSSFVNSEIGDGYYELSVADVIKNITNNFDERVPTCYDYIFLEDFDLKDFKLLPFDREEGDVVSDPDEEVLYGTYVFIVEIDKKPMKTGVARAFQTSELKRSGKFYIGVLMLIVFLSLFYLSSFMFKNHYGEKRETAMVEQEQCSPISEGSILISCITVDYPIEEGSS